MFFCFVFFIWTFSLYFHDFSFPSTTLKTSLVQDEKWTAWKHSESKAVHLVATKLKCFVFLYPQGFLLFLNTASRYKTPQFAVKLCACGFTQVWTHVFALLYRTSSLSSLWLSAQFHLRLMFCHVKRLY